MVHFLAHSADHYFCSCGWVLCLLLHYRVHLHTLHRTTQGSGGLPTQGCELSTHMLPEYGTWKFTVMTPVQTPRWPYYSVQDSVILRIPKCSFWKCAMVIFYYIECAAKAVTSVKNAEESTPLNECCVKCSSFIKAQFFLIICYSCSEVQQKLTIAAWWTIPSTLQETTQLQVCMLHEINSIICNIMKVIAQQNIFGACFILQITNPYATGAK